jgi:hypothetical protein
VIWSPSTRQQGQPALDYEPLYQLHLHPPSDALSPPSAGNARGGLQPRGRSKTRNNNTELACCAVGRREWAARRIASLDEV